MNQDTNLLSDSPNIQQSFEKPTPFPATNGCYRSRIYTSNININPLIAACDQILSLVTALENLELPEDKATLLQDLAHEIRSFEHHAQIADYQPNTIVAARYALCSLLDEAITSTEWGQENNWSEENLLELFHNENHGGDRFFSIIDRSLENSFANLHLIELLYLCLNLGFVGKYRDTEHGQSELIAITNKLYQIINQHNHLNCKNLLINKEKEEQEIEPQRNNAFAGFPFNHKTLFKFVLAFGIAIGSLTYFFVNLNLSKLTKQTRSVIEQIKSENLI